MVKPEIQIFRPKPAGSGRDGNKLGDPLSRDADSKFRTGDPKLFLKRLELYDSNRIVWQRGAGGTRKLRSYRCLLAKLSWSNLLSFSVATKDSAATGPQTGGRAQWATMAASSATCSTSSMVLEQNEP